MDKPYNRYIKDKIDAFLNLIFKYGYDDYELLPVSESLKEAIRDDMFNGIINTHEYLLISSIIDNLYIYVKHVCDDLRKEG